MQDIEKKQKKAIREQAKLIEIEVKEQQKIINKIRGEIKKNRDICKKETTSLKDSLQLNFIIKDLETKLKNEVLKRDNLKEEKKDFIETSLEEIEVGRNDFLEVAGMEY